MADVATAEALRPAYLVDGGVGPRLRLGDAAPEAADAEHAPAIGDDLSADLPGAGMKDLDLVEGDGLVEPFDHRTLVVAPRVALGRHGDGERGLAIPAQIEA